MFGNETSEIFGLKAKNNYLYITGSTSSTNISDYPMSTEHPEDYQDTYSGGVTDAFIATFECTRNTLRWSTLFGGSGEDVANTIDVSNNGDIAVGGLSHGAGTGFPFKDIGGNSYFSNANIDEDGFLTIFYNSPSNPQGFDTKYSTLFGGNGYDKINSLEYSHFGNLFLIGTSFSTNMNTILSPMTNAYNQASLGGTNSNAFLMGMDISYNHVWSTFFGGASNPSVTSDYLNDEGNGIAVSGVENIFICGEARSQTNFPLRSGDDGAFFVDHNASYTTTFSSEDFENYSDGFIAQFSLVGSPLSLKENIQLKPSTFQLYPNPTSKVINITSNLEQNENVKNLKIYDLSGTLVLSLDKPLVVGKEMAINIEDLKSGFYSINIKTNISETNLKFVKY